MTGLKRHQHRTGGRGPCFACWKSEAGIFPFLLRKRQASYARITCSDVAETVFIRRAAMLPLITRAVALSFLALLRWRNSLLRIRFARLAFPGSMDGRAAIEPGGCARAFLSNQQTTATQSRTAGFLSNPGWSSHVSPC